MRRSVLMLLVLPSLVWADDFDRFEGAPLAAVPKSAEAHDQLTIAELGTMPRVVRGVRSAVLVVKTDQDNPARVIVSPALRKPADGKGDPAAILVIERFDTFEA